MKRGLVKTIWRKEHWLIGRRTGTPLRLHVVSIRSPRSASLRHVSIDNHYDLEFLDTTIQEGIIIPPVKYVCDLNPMESSRAVFVFKWTPAQLFHLSLVTPHSLSFPAASESEEGWTGALPQM